MIVLGVSAAAAATVWQYAAPSVEAPPAKVERHMAQGGDLQPAPVAARVRSSVQNAARRSGAAMVGAALGEQGEASTPAEVRSATGGVADAGGRGDSLRTGRAARTGQATRPRRGRNAVATGDSDSSVAGRVKTSAPAPNVAASYGWSLAESLSGPARACARGGDWAQRSPDGRTLYLCGGGRFRVQHDGRVLASCTADGCDKTTLYHLVRGE